MNLDLQDISCLWWEGNYRWIDISFLSSIKMTDSGSGFDSGLVPRLCVSHKFKQGPCHPDSSPAEAIPAHRQPGVELRGSSYHPLAIFVNLPAHLAFRCLTNETAPLGCEREATFLALPFLSPLKTWSAGQHPQTGLQNSCPRKSLSSLLRKVCYFLFWKTTDIWLHGYESLAWK